jgi:hypothetical protein
MPAYGGGGAAIGLRCAKAAALKARPEMQRHLV